MVADGGGLGVGVGLGGGDGGEVGSIVGSTVGGGLVAVRVGVIVRVGVGEGVSAGVGVAWMRGQEIVIRQMSVAVVNERRHRENTAIKKTMRGRKVFRAW